MASVRQAGTKALVLLIGSGLMNNAAVEAALTTNSWNFSSNAGQWETAVNWDHGVPSTNGQSLILIPGSVSSDISVTVDATTVLSNGINQCMTVSNVTIAGSGLLDTLFLRNAGSVTPLRILDSFTITGGTLGNTLVTNSVLEVDGLLSAFNIDGVVSNGLGGSIVVTNGTTTVGSTGTGALFVDGGTMLLNSVRIGSSVTARGTITLNSGTISPLGTFLIGFNAGSTGAMWVTGGQLTMSNGVFHVGNLGSGQLTVSNGTVLAVHEVRIGWDAGSQGTLTVAGGTNLFRHFFEIGSANVNATGTVWVTGGQLTMTNNLMRVGGQGVGRMTVSNGTWQAASVEVGSIAGSQGTLTLAGGTNVVTGISFGGVPVFTVGASAGTTGAVWVTGGQLAITNGAVVIGSNGVGQVTVSNGTVAATNVLVASSPGSRGTLTIAGGTAVLSSALTIGRNANATGTVTMAGGNLFVTNTAGTATLLVGQSGRGLYIQNGGTLTVDRLVVTNDPSSALFQLLGGTVTTKASVYSNGLFNVGTAGNSATLNFQGATHSLLDSLVIAPSANSTGAVWMTASLLTNGTAYIGLNGTGQMAVSNGTWQVGGLVHVGVFSGSRGTLTIAGGTSSVFSNLIIGNFPCSPTGTVVIAGGNLFVTNSTASAVLELRTGSLSLNSGVLALDKFVMTNSCGSLALNSGTLNTSSTTVNNGSLVAIGDGVNAATLHLLGGIHSFANNLRIRTNAFLTGCGTITGNVLVEGTVLADCGTSLNLSGTVTNNGSMTALNGTHLNFFGPVDNNGLIDASGGDVQFFSTISGGGTVLTPTNSWVDGTGKWETSGNWSRGTAPTNTDVANVITNAGNNTVTIDATTSGSFPGTMTIRNLNLSGSGNSTNTLALSNAGLTTPLHVLSQVSLSNNSVVIVNNSAVKVDTNLALGSPVGSANQLIVTNGGKMASAAAVIGGLSATGSTALVTGTNSIWSSLGTIQVGNGSSNDSLTVTDGGALFVTNAAHTALVTVNKATVFLGTAIFQADNLVVTNGGSVQHIQTYQVDNATVTVAGGVVEATSNMVVATTANSTGTVNITGGQLVVTNGVFGVGNSGTLTNGAGVGFVTVSNGTNLVSTILLGSSTGGDGDLTIKTNGVVSFNQSTAGTNTALVVNDLWLDGGLLSITNGTLYCGRAHPGEMTMSNGIAMCQDLYVGYDYSGALAMFSGTMTLNAPLTVGFLAGSTGNVWVAGGQLALNSALPTTIGNAGTGQMTVSNGIVQAGRIILSNGSNPGTLTLEGGTLTANLQINANGRLVFSGGQLQAGATTNANGQSFVVGDGAHPAGLRLIGGVHSFDKQLRIAANATVTGCGTINGNVTIDPGGALLADCGGTLTITGTVTNNGTLKAINGTTVECVGTLVNNGLVDTINGHGSFLSTVINSGIMLDAAGDWDGDGFTNLQEFQAGTDPTNSASALRITSITQVSTNIFVTWTMGPGKTNALERTPGDSNGSFTNSFTAIFTATNTVGTTTNYLDVGAATTMPAFYYRVRLVP